MARLLIGVSLIVYGLHRRRRPVHKRTPGGNTAGGPNHHRGRTDQSGAVASQRGRSSSSLTARMERGSIWPAAAFAVLLQPWGLVAAGGLTVTEADTSHSTTWLVLIAFCVLATASLLAAELYVVQNPAAARCRLLALRTWMEQHAQQAIVVGGIAVGLWLTGRSVYELAG